MSTRNQGGVGNTRILTSYAPKFSPRHWSWWWQINLANKLRLRIEAGTLHWAHARGQYTYIYIYITVKTHHTTSFGWVVGQAIWWTCCPETEMEGPMHAMQCNLHQPAKRGIAWEPGHPTVSTASGPLQSWRCSSCFLHTRRLHYGGALLLLPPPFPPMRATFSHTRLRAHDHCTSSTLIGGKGGAGPSSLLHTTLEGPTEYVNARWMYSLHGFAHGVEWIAFHDHLDYCQKPLLGGRPNTKQGDHWHYERSQPLVYFILSCVKTRMNRNSLK